MPTDKTEYTVKTVQSGSSLDSDTADGKLANQAALKLARELSPADSEAEAESNPTEVTIQNTESGAKFTFDAWAWTEESDGDEDWQPDEITEAAVKPKQLDDPEEWFFNPTEADQWESD